MPTQILMPALSPTMEEGKLAKWLVKEGDVVKSGKVIAEIETDKATMEVEAVDEGIIHQILIAAGTDKVKVNTPIATLLAEGETAGAPAPATVKPAPAASPAGSQAPAIAASASTAAGGMAGAAASGSANFLRPPMLGGTGGDAKASTSLAGSRMFVSPLARRLAKDNGIDLANVKGSGPHGRIIQRDLANAAKGSSPSPGKSQATALTPVTGSGQLQSSGGAGGIQPMADDKILALYEKDSFEVLPHDGMRRIIAERLTQSKSTVPHFYLSVDVRLDTLLSARERLNARSPKEGPRVYKLSVNDFIIKALALALQNVPAANATWTTQGMLRHRHSDVGVAVAVEGGLFTPVIRHAELKTLAEISNEMKDLAERARKRRLAPHEYQGGTTSISNLGMFGIKSFDAVINPPHATILAVGAGEKIPVVNGDKIEIATVMSATMSCDHRVVDGTLGAELLNSFKSFIEDPVRMLV